MTDLENRLRAALRAEADAVEPSADGLQRIQQRVAQRRTHRWARPLVAAAAVAALVAGGVAYSQVGGDRDRLDQRIPATTSSPSPEPSASPSGAPATGVPALPSLLPVWPFADGAAVAAWQHGNGPSRESWRLDPVQVATRFTTDYLGFTDIDRVLSSQVNGDDATVTVGYHAEGTRNSPSAVLHLLRWSGGQDAPWEVVGTNDTDLALTIPSYGATVTSSLAVGGTIRGVDESIRVDVRQPSDGAVLGSSCCTAGGGVPDPGPWQTTVAVAASNDPVLTVVASTGGHVTAHEKFAITAVRNAPASAAATHPTSFVGSVDGRIAVFSVADGSRQRWLTDRQPGGGDSDPQVVGDSVYFLRGGGTCADSLQRVPLAGGTPQPVYAPEGATIGGYGVSVKGALAMALNLCTGGEQRLMVLDPATGRSNETPAMAAPPLIVGDLSWDPDGQHVAAVVKTGMQQGAFVFDAFAVHSILDGTVPCNSTPPAQPRAVAYGAGGGLVLLLDPGGGEQVATCASGKLATLFDTDGKDAWTELTVDTGAVLLAGTRSDGPGTDTVPAYLVWTGGQPTVRTVPSGFAGVSW